MEAIAGLGIGIILVPIIIVQVACGAFCSGIMKAKQYHNNGDWFFWGLLFGIIALIAAAGMPVKKDIDRPTD
jgi:hypothetical protein